MSVVTSALALLVFLLFATVDNVSADLMEYRDGPIPINIQPTTRIGLRHTQIRAPGWIDTSDLSFHSQRGDAIQIHVIFLKQNNNPDHLPYFLDPKDTQGILNMDYCRRTDDDPNPIANLERLEGFHYTVDLNSDGTMTNQTNARRYPVASSGDYALLLTTCQDNRVYAEGVVKVHSSYGFLPAAQVEFALFAVLMCVLSTIVACRYGLRLLCIRSHHTASLTERVLFYALLTMAAQAVFLTSYFVYWNRTGYRPHGVVMYMEMLLELAKHALTFAVAVMVSLGQGYSWTVVALGSWYVVLSIVMEVLQFVLQEFSPEEVQNYDTWSTVLEVVSVLYYGTDAVVILLVLCFLRRTMGYLKRANQIRKLRRYRAFLGLLISILLVTVVGMFANQLRFYSFVISEFGFVAILTTMACLWWPSPENLDYERVMQLPQLDPDGNEIGVVDNEDIDEEFGGLELGEKGDEELFTNDGETER